MRHILLVLSLVICHAPSARAEDWTRFRGNDGSGIATSAAPTAWSDNENLAWKTSLPGPGSSSPIVLGNRIFVTCYSGYGVDAANPGDIHNLTRHLLCIDRAKGDIIWTKALPAEMPEDEYSGFITEHGYASSTPVTDGERVYVFYGKSGVLAYDLDGKELWHVGVGKESSNRRWGSAASPIVVGDALIVNAAEESQSVIALNKLDGKELWKAEASTLELSYGTPALTSDGNATEVILAVPSEIWALNAKNGKLRWFVTTEILGNVSPSVTLSDGVIYATGGIRGSGSMAVRVGGKGDVTDKNVIWFSRNSSYVATPVLFEGHLYWVDDRGFAWCSNAVDGEEVYRERLPDTGGGRPFYASPVLADGKLYCVSRRGGALVLAAKPQFEQIALNRLDDDTDFNATPAIVDGQMFLRSNKALYCVKSQ